MLQHAMSYVIPPPPQPSVAVSGSAARFPVRRIVCVGRNYADHVREMGADPRSDPPIFFTKPADAVCDAGSSVPYPQNTSDLHHEVELVVAIGRGGEGVPVDEAGACVWGCGVGVDLTRRDRQSEAKKAGAPWDVAKAFDSSAPVGPLTPALASGTPRAGRIWLTVNGEIRQEGDLAQMIWSVPEIVAAASRSWRLRPGDLIFTGTPAGVGPLQPGDKVKCGVAGLEDLSFSINNR